MDYLFTQVYYQAAPRNKVSWLKSDELPDSMDYAIFGSSRSIHNLSPKIIEKRTGLTGFNFGCDAAGPVEIALMVKEVLHYSSVRNVYIQVDTKYELQEPDDFGEVIWMPFIHEDQVYDAFKSFGRKYWAYRYIPFYRFQLLSPEIGYRNVILSLAGRKGNFMKEKGYVPIYGFKNKHSVYRDTIQNIENIILAELNEYCEQNGVEVQYFTAPIYASEVDFTPLAMFLPNYTDFSRSVDSMKFFLNATHLNHEGAKVFTEQFADYYFSN